MGEKKLSEFSITELLNLYTCTEKILMAKKRSIEIDNNTHLNKEFNRMFSFQIIILDAIEKKLYNIKWEE